jgi:hypothetical protein
MHFDLIHAAILVGALILTNFALKASGVLGDEGDSRFGWKRFLAYFVVIALVNLILPL